MKEIELKARVSDEQKLKTLISSICGEAKIVNKVDYYFRKPGEKQQALRVRNNNGKLEFTAKKTSHINDGERNLEYEIHGDIKEIEKSKDFFRCLGFEDYFKKIKNGWEWTYDEVHIELLEVNDLGYFLEMEILIPFNKNENDELDAERKLHYYLAKFKVPSENICTKSYRAMILGE